ncbi:MAG: asparagine synthase (glutamine-hydrolyzing) [Chloroflexi bacterium]|nr:asparagine synthase (glutamine-hydrolyzing) [Chloroflexota bacterium]
MCGICGKIYLDRQRPVEPHALERMARQLERRGPDDAGLRVSANAGIASTRLAIIDVPGGHMPLSNEDGTVWVVFNGEIYNFHRLRERLERAGHRFATSSDTEVIVHLYEEEGDDFVRSLNGMFALAVWDERRRRLLLARDQLGVKPLYYAELPDRFLFGSELKALLADGVERRIDLVALHDYLGLNYVPGPRSIVAGIRKLLPGHRLTLDLDRGVPAIDRFWDVPRPAPRVSARRPTGELERELLELLREVVRDQMISDVPLGAFLSGGVDSSLIVALMSEVSEQPVRTFSIGFKERSFDELDYARLVADRFGTEHHELVLEPRAHELVAAVADYFDEPFADSSALAVYAVAELAASHVKVALSGEGGDEVFGGYYTYQADRLAALYRRLPSLVGRRLLPALVELLPASDQKASFDFKLKRFVAGGALPPLPAHYTWKAFLDEDAKRRLYRPALGNPLVDCGDAPVRPTLELFRRVYDGYPGPDVLNRLLYVDLQVQLVDDMLTKVDRMSMAHSLEVRVPLLDPRLVEHMAELPSDLKVWGLSLKYLLKRAAARVLPREILTRRKAGFHVPIAKWLKGELADLVDEQLGPRTLVRQGVFDPKLVGELLTAHRSGRRDHSRNIWSLLMFGLWYDRYAQPLA